MASRTSEMQRVHKDLAEQIRQEAQKMQTTQTAVSKQMADQLKRLKNDQRASAEDLPFFIVSMFTLALMFLGAFYVWGVVSANVQPALVSADPSNSVASAFTTGDFIFNNMLNYIFLAGFMGLLLIMCITAFMTPTNPIFLVFFILSSLASLLVATVLSNAYEAVSQVSQFTTATTTLSIPHQLMMHLPTVTVVVAVLLGVLLYSRSNTGGTTTQSIA